LSVGEPSSGEEGEMYRRDGGRGSPFRGLLERIGYQERKRTAEWGEMERLMSDTFLPDDSTKEGSKAGSRYAIDKR